MSKTIYVSEDGKRRKATAEEIAQFEKDQAEALERASVIEAETAKKEADRASAIAKLSALGLNEDEVNAIIGG